MDLQDVLILIATFIVPILAVYLTILYLKKDGSNDKLLHQKKVHNTEHVTSVKSQDKNKKEKKEKNKKSAKKSKEDLQVKVNNSVAHEVDSKANENKIKLDETLNTSKITHNMPEEILKSNKLQEKQIESQKQNSNLDRKDSKNGKQKQQSKQEKNIEKKNDENKKLKNGFKNEKLTAQHFIEDEPVVLQDTSSILNLENDISVTKLVEIIKTIPLSSEETQVIVDALLSKNNDGSSDWIKKNDPITVLKKQLEEREEELKAESQNHDRTKSRVSVLNEQLKIEKYKHLIFKEQIDSLQQNIEILVKKLEKSTKDNSEMSLRQEASFEEIKWKLTMEKENLNKDLTAERSKVNGLLEQLKSEKAKLEYISFEILKQEQDFFGKIKNLEAANTSLKEQVGLLENKLQVNDIQFSEELSKKKEELESALNDTKSKLNCAENAISQLQDKINTLESINKEIQEDNKSLLSKNKALQQENNMVLSKNKSLEEEKDLILSKNKNLNDEKELILLKNKNLEDEKIKVFNTMRVISPTVNQETLSSSLKDLIQEYQSLQAEVISSKNEFSQGYKDLESKLAFKDKEIEALKNKVYHYEQTLSNAAKDLNQISKTAEEEAKAWKLKIEDTETAYKEIVLEHDYLNKEKEEIEKVLKSLKDLGQKA